MPNLLQVSKLTYTRFLNLFEATFSNGKKYFFASRRDEDSLTCHGSKKVDAVRILPYTYDESGKIQVVVTEEFRYPVNQYIYGTPAGLIDDGETSEQAAIRELNEEIGAEVIKIEQILKPSYSSAGMTDETLECFEAEVKLGGAQKLDEYEDIKFHLLPLEEVLTFIAENQFGLQSALQLHAFYYKHFSK